MDVNMVGIREFNEERDREKVGKLERKCGMKGSNKGVSIFTNMMGKGDPLYRIRLYPLHLMLVAELRETGELVGVVRGCIKHVGSTKLGGTNVKLGCVLGLRVSPNHRRIGVGYILMKSVEEWMARNGADYISLATEKSNVASTNLFTSKCNYVQFSSLVIFVQAISAANNTAKRMSQDIKIEKLHLEQAISLYEMKLKYKDMYPTDIGAILKESMSLGTWVIYFKEEKWICPQEKENDVCETPSSWFMFSVWSGCNARKSKVRIRNKTHVKFLHAALGNARDKMLPCLKVPSIIENKRFGFMFLYGIHGEGERAGELMRSAWGFALRLAETMKDCKVVLTEMGVSDPLMQYLAPQEFMGLSSIDDLWYIKRASSLADEEDGELREMGEIGTVFVDPRDF